MMNKIFKCLLAAALLASAGCTKIPSISDEPFTLTLKSAQSQAVWVDIIPESNDFSYSFGTVSVEEYNRLYKSDEALIQSLDRDYKKSWEDNFKDVMSFRDAFLYKGAYFLHDSPLQSETEYYFIAFPYDDSDNPVFKSVKLKFKTVAYTESDIDFGIALTGSIVSVTPSNDKDSYYFDYDTIESVKKDFGDSPAEFFNYMVYKYEEYGFMSGLIHTGISSADLSDYLVFQPGQQFYLVASGYNNGINGPLRIYKITYNGEGLPGDAELVEETYD